MRIVFATFSKESMSGGAGRVAFEIAQAFARQGHDVVLVLPGNKTQVKKIEPNLRHLEIKSLNSEGGISVPYLTVNNLQFLFNFLEKFSPQIIHAHDFGPICLVAQFWAINHQIPFVYTAHVMPTKRAYFTIGQYSKALSRLMDTELMKRYFTTFFKDCDAMIALNKEAEKDILKSGFRQKIFMIPNGRDLKIYQRCRLSKLSEKPKQLTFVGYLAKSKNQKYLLRVMNFLPDDFALNLVGTFINPRYLQELKDEVQKKGLKNINFIGEVSHNQIPDLLEKTHLFVSASTMEVQSLAVIEALASGTPVVGLANETNEELVDDSVGFCLEKKTSPKFFAEKVQKIFSLSQREYEALCRQARKKVVHLDWPIIVEQTKRAYLELIEEKKNKDKGIELKKIKEILELLPTSKFKSFLKKQVQIQSPKMANLKKKNALLFALTIFATFFLGIFYWLSNKIKRISLLMKLHQ